MGEEKRSTKYTARTSQFTARTRRNFVKDFRAGAGLGAKAAALLLALMLVKDAGIG